MSRGSRSAPLLLALWLAACGASAPPPASAGPAPAPQGPARPWGELSFAERKQHMNDHVLPLTEAEFKAFDSARYASFSCATCHGPDMVVRKFAMPNPSLYALHPTGSPEQQRMVREQPEMTRFMYSKVLPSVQKLLGAPDYDPATQRGFSCYACHPSATPVEAAGAPAAAPSES